MLGARVEARHVARAVLSVNVRALARAVLGRVALAALRVRRRHSRLPSEHWLPLGDIKGHRRNVMPGDLAAVGPALLAAAVVEQVAALVLHLHQRLAPAAHQRKHLVAHRDGLSRGRAARQQRQPQLRERHLPRGAVGAVVDLTVAIGVAAALATVTVDAHHQLDALLALRVRGEVLGRADRHAVHLADLVADVDPRVQGAAAGLHLEDTVLVVQPDAKPPVAPRQRQRQRLLNAWPSQRHVALARPRGRRRHDQRAREPSCLVDPLAGRHGDKGANLERLLPRLRLGHALRRARQLARRDPAHLAAGQPHGVHSVGREVGDGGALEAGGGGEDAEGGFEPREQLPQRHAIQRLAVVRHALRHARCRVDVRHRRLHIRPERARWDVGDDACAGHEEGGVGGCAAHDHLPAAHPRANRLLA